MTDKDFPDEGKCLKSASSLIEKTREKGYVETLPEYSEWSDTYKEYAIWRSPEAIEFIINALKENSRPEKGNTQKQADDALNEILDHVQELEILLYFDTIRIRMMAATKYPYDLYLDMDDLDMFSARTPEWAMKYDSVGFRPNNQFKPLIVEYFNQNGKGRWFDEKQQADSPAEQAAQQKQHEAYIKKLRDTVSSTFKKTTPNISIQLSMLNTSRTYIGDPEEYEKDVLPLIFDHAASKVDKDYEEVLTKVYYMLHNLRKPLPLGRLKAALNDLKDKKEISLENLYQDTVFEPWENLQLLQIPEIDPTNKEDICRAAAYIAENADAYILQTRFFNEYIQIRKKTDKKDEPLDELNFFELTAPYPELEEYIATYVEKLVEHNKSYPTYLNFSGSADDIPLPVGYTAAAVLAIFNGSKYDRLIASFLNTIKKMKWYPTSCSAMRNIWKDNGVNPEVPETVSVMTKKS